MFRRIVRKVIMVKQDDGHSSLLVFCNFVTCWRPATALLLRFLERSLPQGLSVLEVSPSWEASAVRFVPVKEAEAIEEPRLW